MTVQYIICLSANDFNGARKLPGFTLDVVSSLSPHRGKPCLAKNMTAHIICCKMCLLV